MSEEQPIEIGTDHACLLGQLTERIAERARTQKGDLLGEWAREQVERLVRSGEFESCCVPHYVSLAPQKMDRELQIPVRSIGDIDTRVLLWPVGASDSDHPHEGGWAVVVPVRGDLEEVREQDGGRPQRRKPEPRQAEIVKPRDGVEHHIENHGKRVGLSVHVFGK